MFLADLEIAVFLHLSSQLWYKLAKMTDPYD